MNNKKILIVEDEDSLRVTLLDRLEGEGYEVLQAADAAGARQMAAQEHCDLIILDVMLPGGNGFDICRDLRQQGNSTPVLMLTARREVVDRVVGLKLGADDYLTKPFDMMELLARVEALLRRGGSNRNSGLGVYVFGEIKVDFNRSEVFRQGRELSISALEFKLLKYFIENRGIALDRNRLLDDVWGYDAVVNTRTVDVHVAGLRQKLETKPEHPEYIVTIHRTGYKFIG